jgi:Fe-S cluster biogenesis protein NfuA/nitrite reductase/ring-hydroxylating ferredoxin subunit
MAAVASNAEAARTSSAAEQLMERIEDLTAQLETLDDRRGQQIGEALTAAIIQMYGAGLQRIVEIIDGAGATGEPIKRALVDDGVVASLLLIHGLYPVPLEQRVIEGLERVRPYMESHGGDVELLEIRDGVARLRLQGSCKSCAASASTLELAVRQALEEAAPDLAGMDVEGMDPDMGFAEFDVDGIHKTATAGAVELPMAAPAPSPASLQTIPSWFELGGVAELARGAMAAVNVAGIALVVANVEGTLLAYRDRCAGCAEPLGSGQMSDGVLACSGCGQRWSLPAAGRSLDGSGQQLEPVPLLREQERVKVALVT